MEKQRTAYLVSAEFGTVLIGWLIFQPETGAIFRATSRKGWKNWPSCTVSGQDMAAAKEALRIFSERAIEDGWF